MSSKIKHLEFIQGVINRLASDSFRIKGWAVILVSAILVLLIREGRTDLAWIGFVPVLVFWGLDGYFLWQERLFRDLYDHVRALPEERVDFSMNTSAFQRSWRSAVLSITLCPFYAALVTAAAIALFLG
ncbi:MAG: hypothetical protein OXC53_08765 [Rhodobacteraceae bacterium]|nr:hypothetical protein [Paracoccaceae bacterium]